MMKMLRFMCDFILTSATNSIYIDGKCYSNKEFAELIVDRSSQAHATNGDNNDTVQD